MRFNILTILLALFLLKPVYASNPLAPFNLRSCDKVLPTGTSNSPFFGWYINDPDDNEIQTAYQIMVASSSPLLAKDKADFWDSGKVLSRKQNYIDFKGKNLAPGSRYYWKVRTWDKDGNISAWSAFAYFDTGLFSAKDWNGAVWIKRGTTDANDYTYFRKQIDLNEKPIKRAVVYLTAFHNYELFINGKLIDKGLAHHYPQYAFYNAYDVTEKLKFKNTFAAMTHWYGGGQGRAKGDRGFLLKLCVEYTDGTKQIFGTDKNWKQTAVEAFNAKTKRRNGEGVGYIDIIDSRKEITDWNEPGFNDENWQNAIEIGKHPVAPFIGELQPDLTRLKEKSIKPISVKKQGKDSYLIDLGKIYAGVPEISFEGGNAGDTVSIYGGFVLNEDETVSKKINQNTDMSYYYVLNGKKSVFKPTVYLAYRYLQVDHSPLELTTENVNFITRHFELAAEKAHFSSSNAMLNQVWDLMVHSLTLGAQEGFVDTPTREKGEFLGDAFSQGVAAMIATGERSLNHRTLLTFLDSQDQYWPDGRLNSVYPNVDGKRDIPDFTQQYLLWAWDYYMQTGNLEFLQSNYQKLLKIAKYVDFYKNESTGLIHKLEGGSAGYKYGIIDWPAPMRYGYDMDADARTVINMYAYADFKTISKIAAAVGNKTDVAVWNAKADSLKNAINKKLINKEGVYIDGLYANGTQSEHVSQHANMFPLAMGIVPQNNKKAVIEAIKERKMSVGMVTVRFLPEAIGQAEEGSHLLELYTNTEWDGWAKTIMMGGTATWESWSALDRNESLCHPWGVAGLGAISEYILGVKILKPQHELIQVKPLDFEGKLTSVSGVCPTDKGDIKVEWKRDLKKFLLTLNSPDNVSAVVYIPKGNSASAIIKVDGKATQGKINGNYIVVENIGSGIHVFEKDF